jgi:hypothetical protein
MDVCYVRLFCLSIIVMLLVHVWNLVVVMNLYSGVLLLNHQVSILLPHSVIYYLMMREHLHLSWLINKD